MRAVLNALFAVGAVHRIGPAPGCECRRRYSLEPAGASQWQAARGGDGADTGPAATLTRRALLAFLALESASTSPSGSTSANAAEVPGEREISLDMGTLTAVRDPASYSALAYSPRGAAASSGKTPLLIVLPGAAQNTAGVWSLADPAGEHMGLAPSLLASGAAPFELARNFAVVTPYPEGKRSFYEEPRAKVLRFIDWVCSEAGREAGCPANIDLSRIFLFGFSDGATVGVELATTGRFAACVFAAYGLTGTLPPRAVELLSTTPLWIFHSEDDGA